MYKFLYNLLNKSDLKNKHYDLLLNYLKLNKQQYFNNLNLIFKFNKDEELKLLFISKFIQKLLNQIQKLIINNNIFYIYITKPSININLDTFNIKFYYYITSTLSLKSKSLFNIENKVLNIFNLNINSLSIVLTRIFNKKFIIELVRIKYNYTNNEIIIKFILDNIFYLGNKNKINIKLFTLIFNLLPKYNLLLISKKYISNLLLLKNLNNKNISILNKKFNDSINIKYLINNNLNNNLIIWNTIMGKYTVGIDLIIKGRTENKNVIRSIKYNYYSGTFNNYIYTKNLLLNKLSNNIIILKNYQITNFNKNGLYNIKLKLNNI